MFKQFNSKYSYRILLRLLILIKISNRSIYVYGGPRESFRPISFLIGILIRIIFIILKLPNFIKQTSIGPNLLYTVQ